MNKTRRDILELIGASGISLCVPSVAQAIWPAVARLVLSFALRRGIYALAAAAGRSTAAEGDTDNDRAVSWSSRASEIMNPALLQKLSVDQLLSGPDAPAVKPNGEIILEIEGTNEIADWIGGDQLIRYFCDEDFLTQETGGVIKTFFDGQVSLAPNKTLWLDRTLTLDGTYRSGRYFVIPSIKTLKGQHNSNLVFSPPIQSFSIAA